MDYLENNICKLTPLFNIDYKKKKNLICGSLFRMKNSYRDINKYVNGIPILTEVIKKHLPDFTFRLFIDNSIYTNSEIIEKLLFIKNLEIVVYHCIDFVRDDIYHAGCFGTMVRLFPMFDFPNNDADIVLINEVDLNSIDEPIFGEEMYTILKQYKKLDKIHFFNIGEINSTYRFSYNVMTKLHDKYDNIINVYTQTSFISSIKRLPPEPIINYLNHILHNKNEFYSYYEYYLQANNEPRIAKELEQFIYGVDEYFINAKLIPYIIDHKIPYATKIDWDIISPIRWAHTVGYRLNTKQKKILKEFKNMINAYELSKINDIIIKHRKNGTYYNKIYELYKIFILSIKNEEIKFIYTDIQYELVLDHIGIYDLSIIKFNNIKESDIIVHALKLKESDYKKITEIYDTINQPINTHLNTKCSNKNK
jgi:hypothetical protein